MTTFVMVISIVLGSGALAYGYFLAGFDAPARWFLLLGGFWLIAQWRRWRWAASVILLIFIAAAAFGLWFNLPASLMVVGAVGGLLGWDLADFTRRLRFASATDDLRGLEVRHLARALIVAIVSLLIAGVVSLVRIRMPFELAVILVLLAVFGLTRLIAWLQRGSD